MSEAALRESESDLLYEVAYGESGERVWLYLLFEHQSTPDRWMRFRLLKYCCRIWEAGIRDGPGQSELRPIVPLVFYQGGRGWRHSTEFADLFPAAAREWPWVPRFEHVLLDQTGVEPDGVKGGVKGRVAQLLMMAAYGRHVVPAVDMAARLLGSLFSSGGVNYFRLFIRYVVATQDEADVQAFDEALRRHGREQGGEIMSYGRQLLEEGKRLGEQHAKVEMVEGFLRAGVAWGSDRGRYGSERVPVPGDQGDFAGVRQVNPPREAATVVAIASLVFPCVVTPCVVSFRDDELLFRGRRLTVSRPVALLQFRFPEVTHAAHEIFARPSGDRRRPSDQIRARPEERIHLAVPGWPGL